MEKLLKELKRGSIRRWPMGLLAAALIASVSCAELYQNVGEEESEYAIRAGKPCRQSQIIDT